MITLHQILTKTPRSPKHRKSFRPMLNSAPQRAAVISKVGIRAPKKPNSAQRTIATGYLFIRQKPKTPFSRQIAKNARLFKPKRRKILIHIHVR